MADASGSTAGGAAPPEEYEQLAKQLEQQVDDQQAEIDAQQAEIDSCGKAGAEGGEGRRGMQSQGPADEAVRIWRRDEAALQPTGGHRRVLAEGDCDPASKGGKLAIATITRECCDEPSEDCAGGVLRTCNEGCSAILLPFWQTCERGLAKAVRKRPYQVSLLIGGVDAPLVAPASKSAAADGAAAAEEKGAASVAAEEKHVPSLFFLDYMGTLQKVNFAAQGICGNFILSLFDRHWKAGMTMDEAKELVHACLEELKTRFMLSQPNFSIKVVNAAGSEVLDASWQVS